MNRVIRKINQSLALGRLKNYDRLDEERLRDLQWAKLKRLLKIAYESVPFYQERFRAIGATPVDIRSFEDFSRFPVLTRDDVLQHADRMTAVPFRRLERYHSGGSTGYPLHYYTYPDYKYFIRASRERARSWIGADRAKPIFTVWGHTIQSNVPEHIGLWHRLTKSHYRYGFANIRRSDLEKLSADCRKVQPKMMTGYMSLLRALAQFHIEEGIRLLRPPNMIISAAETLTEEDRRIIETGLGARVYNAYGANENGDVAMECRVRCGLHILADHVYMEILADGSAALKGQPGYITVTDLDNLAMPFIRYMNADVGVLSEEKCSCGMRTPLLKSVMGRNTDFIFDGSGAAYPGNNLMAPLRKACDEGHVRQFQLLQAGAGQLRVLAVPGVDMDDGDGPKIVQALRGAFKGTMAIELDWVETVATEPSGKTRFSKSAVSYDSIWRKP